jgi:arginine decarboxylase
VARDESQRRTPLADAVDAFLADRSVTPFTTPGHKRSPELADPLLLLDLPLSAGADDLHLSADVLGQAERLAAELWDSDLCLFCVNGSTQGNQALCLALAGGRQPSKVVVARNVHKSVLAGLVLAGLDPVWVRPAIDAETGLALALPVEAVAAALAEHPDAAGVVVVEPNYVGALADVPALARACHGSGVPLVVDQAWGAYLGFHPELPAHALTAGADAMVTSAHKTLTGFTQSAYLFARGGLLDLRRVREGFDALNTTSPSAAILASLDRTRALIALRGKELLGRTIRLVAQARERLGAIDGLAVLGPRPGLLYDPTKLVLALAGTGADGLEVEADLYADGVRVELANRDTLVPLVTIGDTEESVERLAGAVERSLARRRAAPRAAAAVSALWSVEPEKALTPRAAFFAPRQTVRAEAAIGRVCAETISPYPPGIPAVAPGEVITKPLLDALRQAAADGTRIAYCADPALETVQVVAR